MRLRPCGAGWYPAGRLLIGLLATTCTPRGGRLTIGRRIPSCPTIAQTLLVIIASLLPLAAQTPAAPAAKAEPKRDASPVPVEESWLTGSIDAGYRWRSDVGGSFDTYRSIVNLGSGPKLLGADFTLLDRKSRVFDQVRIRGYSWGDDPYSTFHLDAKKTKLYDFTADYRNIAYFNYLPSYADPLIARGVFLNEQ